MSSFIVSYNFVQIREPNCARFCRYSDILIKYSFPDDQDRDGPLNVGLLAIQPPDAAAFPRIFFF
jgi:hypothetical protein